MKYKLYLVVKMPELTSTYATDNFSYFFFSTNVLKSLIRHMGTEICFSPPYIKFKMAMTLTIPLIPTIHNINCACTTAWILDKFILWAPCYSWPPLIFPMFHLLDTTVSLYFTRLQEVSEYFFKSIILRD